MNLSRARSLCIDPARCPHGDASDELCAAILPCFDCALFWEGIHAVAGRGGDDASGALAEALLREQEHIDLLYRKLEIKGREVDFLHDVGIFLQGSLGRDEVIVMALTAITSGKGYGLNRAILLLVDEESERLNGYLAVGPRTPDEGGRIWSEIAQTDYSLEELARRFLSEKLATERERFRDLLDGLSISLTRSEHLFTTVLESRRSAHIVEPWREPGLDHWQVELLGGREFVLVPLVSGARRIGILLADNIVSGAPIAEEDLHRLETFALPVSYAIERAALYERLRQELDRLTEAHHRLSEQQELIVRMEKLALIGEMSADIAHRIRNPLTIIGGYARRLLKGAIDDEQRHALEVIVRESGLIGETVGHLLEYAATRHPTFDRWDLCQSLAAVIDPRREEMQRLGIACHFDLPALEMPAIYDFKKIGYCLNICLSHAIDALPRGGRLDIALTAEGDAFCVRIVTADQGGPATALPPEENERLIADEYREFELALCMRIVEQQGGRLEKNQTEAGGVVYSVILRAAKEKNDGQTAAG